MKLAVIIAVIHMLFGILLKVTNSFYFSKFLDLFMVDIPQIAFMVCTVGFMDYLIIKKWLISW